MVPKLNDYIKNNKHDKQMSFHKDMTRNRWVFGGNRTGKTECGAVEAVLWALGEHPHREIGGATEGWVVSLSLRFGRDVAQRKILKYLDKKCDIAEIVMLTGRQGSPERGIIDYVLVHNKFGSLSKIGFKSCDQGREKFQGEGLNWVWFDEEPPEDICEECLLRTLDKEGSCIWGTMTPLKGKSWVYERLFLNEGEDINCMFMSWEDNPYLPPAEVKKMQGALSAAVLESRKYGRFMEGTGMVFSEFTDENVIDPFDLDRTWYTCISIDPGFTNPCAVLWIAVDHDDNIYVVDDYSVAEQTVEQHAQAIKKTNAELGFENCALIDSAALQKTLGSAESVVEQFERCGIRVDTKVNKEVFGGIMRMKSLFCNANGVRKLFVFRTCVNLIKELRTYWWGRNEKPIKKNDHCIDALRYFVSTSYQNEMMRDIISARTEKGKTRSFLSINKRNTIRQAKTNLWR